MCVFLWENQIVNAKKNLMWIILTLPLDGICPMAQCMMGVWGGGSLQQHSLVDGCVACHLVQLGYLDRLFQRLFLLIHCTVRHMGGYSSFSRRLVHLRIILFCLCNHLNQNATYRYSSPFHPVSYLYRTSILVSQQGACYLLKPQQVYQYFFPHIVIVGE